MRRYYNKLNEPSRWHSYSMIRNRNFSSAPVSKNEKHQEQQTIPRARFRSSGISAEKTINNRSSPIRKYRFIDSFIKLSTSRLIVCNKQRCYPIK
ncbi:hypothetical protein PUN28_004146 [Cardiocondyla obscurior]|uniref:Ribosomal protein S18 n=1 Tax=Cardiocondyla obscurior TaxID=286306 RepID=A0AAW2GPR3_9HYME